MTTRRIAAVYLALALTAGPALAHHRQAPAVAALTTSGDTSLPRVPAPGRHTLALAVAGVGGTQIVKVRPFIDPTAQTVVATPAGNAGPAVSFTGTSVAYDTDADPLARGLPGRQVVVSANGMLVPVSSDPTGTSTNPSVDTVGLRVVFESQGDLAGTGNPGARQVFLRQPDGSITQLSRGVGTSGNAVASPKRGLVVFESTSQPETGADTGVSQIWLGSLLGDDAAPLTAGLGPSRNAQISDDARIIVFESEADLAGNGAATGVPQIYMYDTKTLTYARVTQDAGGCRVPAVLKVKRDWRIAFVCSGVPYYFMLRANQRFEVQASGGVTERVIPELGIHFVLLSTTANLLEGGTTAGKQVYMVNLFKRPPLEVATPPATWFPFQGIGPL